MPVYGECFENVFYAKTAICFGENKNEFGLWAFSLYSLDLFGIIVLSGGDGQAYRGIFMDMGIQTGRYERNLIKLIKEQNS